MTDVAPASEHYPVVTCPRCKAEQADMDGFGFIACVPGCGFCTHPSSTKVPSGLWICGICGEEA